MAPTIRNFREVHPEPRDRRNLRDMASLPFKPGSDASKRLVDYAREDNAIPVFKDGADKSWYRGDISSSRWNKSFPYQLRIVVKEPGADSYKDAGLPGGTYTLPIPPESLSIDTPYAIQTSITMGGSIEEHNGAPIRMINLSGTTGVLLGKAPGETSKTLTFVDSIFAGTISAAKRTSAALNQLTSIQQSALNVHKESDFEDIFALGKLTGYYQMRVLQGFLESYAEMKKSGAQNARQMRLAWCMWKDEAVYLVTPVSFRMQRSASSPLEYTYSIQFKATKRVLLDKGIAELLHPYEPKQKSPAKLAKFLSAIESARQVLQGAKQTIAAVGGDFNSVVFGTMREMTLLVKDALSIPLSVADLSDSVIQEAARAILDLSGTRSAVSNFSSNLEDRFRNVSKNAQELGRDFVNFAGEKSDTAVGNGVEWRAHPLSGVFANPTANYDFFSGVQVGDLNLPPATVSKIAGERARVANMSRLDFEVRRDAIAEAIDTFSRSLGLGHATFDKTFGISPVVVKVVDAPSEADYDVLFALNRLLQEMNGFVVVNVNEPQNLLDTLSTVAGLAEKSGIAFQIPRSKFAVPFPYGSTIEMLSARYLGDPNRWHEIVVLNGLKAPYVDEEGFTLSLLVNGNGGTIVVADASNLFVGQTIWIGSTAAVRARRRIRSIDRLTPGQYQVTVDGNPDLDKYATLASAHVFAFLPNTVNSQQVIYIPSDAESRDDEYKNKAIPGVNEQDSLISVGGADLLLTPKNDLVITPDGDTKWAVGLTNITQKIRLAFSVRKGTLPHHPEYGFPVEPGASIADIEASDIVRSCEAMFKGDPSYNGIKAAQVNISGPVARIAVAVEVRGTEQVIPVSVEVRR